ncbi:MAG: hypothetical protein BGN88_02970, partial [Clostridiales bacterium 43-6]
RLAQITQVLADSNVDIRALSIADTTNFGILRLIVNKPDLAETKLKEAGLTVSLTDVIAIEISDRPGGLSAALKVLNDAEIGVEYMYAFIGTPHEKAFVILRVENNDSAIQVLKDNGVGLLKTMDVYDI